MFSLLSIVIPLLATFKQAPPSAMQTNTQWTQTHTHIHWALTGLFCSPSCAQWGQRVCLSSPACCLWGWMGHFWGCWRAHGEPQTSAFGHRRSEERKQPWAQPRLSQVHALTLWWRSLFLSSFVPYSNHLEHALIKLLKKLISLV